MPIKNYTCGVGIYTSFGKIQGALASHGARKIMIEHDGEGQPIGVTSAIDAPNRAGT